MLDGTKKIKDSYQDIATIDEVVKKSGDVMTGVLAMGGNRIGGVGTPTADGDAARKIDIDSKVYQYPDGSYNGSDDADAYTIKPKIAIMEINNLSTGWPAANGVLVTFWATDQRAKQIVYEAGPGNRIFFRQTHPAIYPSWSAFDSPAQINTINDFTVAQLFSKNITMKQASASSDSDSETIWFRGNEGGVEFAKGLKMTGGSGKELMFDNNKVYYAGNSGPFYKGSGSPEGNVTAPVGAIYQREDGGANSTLYVKESGSGNVGWVAK